MGRVCKMYGVKRKVHRILVGKPEETIRKVYPKVGG
jgi:hypothetical protein